MGYRVLKLEYREVSIESWYRMLLRTLEFDYFLSLIYYISLSKSGNFNLYYTEAEVLFFTVMH